MCSGIFWAASDIPVGKRQRSLRSRSFYSSRSYGGGGGGERNKHNKEVNNNSLVGDNSGQVKGDQEHGMGWKR